MTSTCKCQSHRRPDVPRHSLSSCSVRGHLFLSHLHQHGPADKKDRYQLAVIMRTTLVRDQQDFTAVSSTGISVGMRPAKGTLLECSYQPSPFPHRHPVTILSVGEKRPTHRTFPMARPKCLMGDFTNLYGKYKAHQTNVWWIMQVFPLHCILGASCTYHPSLPHRHPITILGV